MTKLVKLGDICEILNGFAFKSEKYTNDGIRIIRITNVQKGKIEDSSPVFYPLNDVNALNYALKEGDILISLTGNVGRVAVLTKEFLPAALNQRVGCIRIKKNISIEKSYLFHYLNSNYFERKCIESARGVAQKNMSTNWLKECEISILPLSEQKKIASVLDKVESLIALRQSQLTQLDTLVKSRFLEMFGDIKKNWEMIPLGNLCDIYRGGSPRPISKFLGGTIPWIKISDATKSDNIYLHKTQECIIEEGVKKSRFVKKGSLILANSGVSLGFARIILFDGCIHDGWLSLENISPKLDKIFLLQALNQCTEHFREIAPSGTQPNLNTSIMKNYLQIIPPLKLQQSFVTFVVSLDNFKQKISESLTELETLKSALMQKYFG